MEQEPILLDSAYRHGVTDEAMLHALRFPVRHFVQADSMTMFIGPIKQASSWKSAPGPNQVSEVNHMTRRSIEDIKARADEFADAFENYDPKPGDQDAPLPPTMAVKLAAWRRDAAEKELAEAVRAAREQRLSWREVGEAIGTSGEAARQRYSPSA